MKTAFILYKKEDAAINRVLIAKYFAALRAMGIRPGLVISDRLGYGEVFDLVRGAGFVINRTRDHGLAAFLESRGVFVSNPAVTNETANDKLLTYLRLSSVAPMLETRLLPREGEPPFPYPFVAKPAAGHGGKGVSMIRNAEDLAAFREACGEKAVAQPAASELGRDMRVYVVGGKPAAAMLRESDTDFRSNFSLGGRARFVPLSELAPDELSIVEAVSAALPLHYAGVDIMRDNGRAILNEIEDPVGARMLYINTAADPALMHAAFAKALAERLDEKNKTPEV